MKTAASPTKPAPASRRVKHEDSLAFVDQGRSGTVVPDLRERLEAFFQRHPRRTLKRKQRGIVDSLKADRDRH